MLWGLALIPIVVGSYVALRGRNHWPAFLMLLGLIVLLLAMTRPRAILLLPSRLETVMLAIDSYQLPASQFLNARAKAIWHAGVS